MSSAGGGSGVGSSVPQQQQQPFTMLEGGNIQLPNGTQVDLTTPAGVAAAEAVLSPEQLADLVALMKGIGFKREGGVFVPRDAYEMRTELGVVGPSSTTVGKTSLDVEIGEKVFGKLGLPNPYNANTTEKLYGLMKDSSEFTSAVSASNEYMANPTNNNQAEFISRMNALSAQFPNGNIMEVLFLVFRESIKETNEDKKYFLIKLQEFNKMAEKISEYLSYLVKRSQALSEACEGQKYPEKVHINVDCKTFDLMTLNTSGEMVGQRVDPKQTGFEKYSSFEQYFSDNKQKYQDRSGDDDGYGYGQTTYNEARARSDFENGKAQQAKNEADAEDGIISRSLDRAGLNDTIKDVESMQETIRNKRQMASTAFQNFDQKANQLYNLMASVLKSLNEMRGGTVRNML